MEKRNVPWKAEWKAAGLDPGPLSPDEEALVSGLRQENETFLRNHPYAASSTGRKTPLFWSLPLAAAAAAVLLAVVPLAKPVSPIGMEHVKGSGDISLTVYRQGKGGAEKLVAGSVVHPGDVLQAAYKVPKTAQGALISIDGNRNVTVHFSREGSSKALLDGGEHPLETSYELDKAPRFEVFFLIVSSKPFDLAPVVQIIKNSAWDALQPNAFGSDVQFAVLPLTKELSQ